MAVISFGYNYHPNLATVINRNNSISVKKKIWANVFAPALSSSHSLNASLFSSLSFL